jgi:hypothetical protein
MGFSPDGQCAIKCCEGRACGERKRACGELAKDSFSRILFRAVRVRVRARVRARQFKLLARERIVQA